jgi:hypothetical protein
MAAGLARDPQGLAALRGQVRGMFLASPVCDAAAYGARFGAALRGMWRERCRSGA